MVGRRSRCNELHFPQIAFLAEITDEVSSTSLAGDGRTPIAFSFEKCLVLIC